MEADEYNGIQAEASFAYEDATGLYKAGHVSFARHSLQALMKRFQEKVPLHRHHHILFNATSYLLNASMRQSDFVDAKKHCERIVDSMRHGPIPKDFPELADYQFRLGEILEVLSTITASNDGQELIGDEDLPDPKDLKALSVSAFEDCLRVRETLYGARHPKTLQVQRELNF